MYGFVYNTICSSSWIISLLELNKGKKGTERISALMPFPKMLVRNDQPEQHYSYIEALNYRGETRTRSSSPDPVWWCVCASMWGNPGGWCSSPGWGHLSRQPGVLKVRDLWGSVGMSWTCRWGRRTWICPQHSTTHLRASNEKTQLSQLKIFKQYV